MEFSECFMEFLALFDIYEQRTEFLSREPDFQEFLKKPQNMFSWCFLSVSWYFKHNSTSEPRTGFFSQESDFQIFLKKPQNMFSWCFLSVSWYFSIVRNLSREPDFLAENRIFENFSKSLKICLVGVFWVFHGIFALFDIWAENRIFQPRIGFSKIS